jgi:hypothetical protein
VRSLRVTRPVSVSREQTGPWVKWDRGEVWCHQQVDDPERSAGVGLVGASVEPQRVVAVPAEADVDQPRSRGVNIDAEGEVIERRPQPVGAEDAGGQQGHPEAQGGQQGREGAIELIAESPSASLDELVDQRLRVEQDRLAKVDAEVLERHREQVAQLQLPQGGGVGPRGVARADSRQVGVQLRW